MQAVLQRCIIILWIGKFVYYVHPEHDQYGMEAGDSTIY